MTRCVSFPETLFFFPLQKGDPGKTGEQGSAGVAGQRVSALFYNPFGAVFISLPIPIKTQFKSLFSCDH